MPLYEYLCVDCHKEFTRVLTLSEHERSELPVCPHCGSHKVEQEVSAFFAVTGKKS